MKRGFDYIGVSVCFFCHDGKGNLLLQKRNKNCRDEQNTWDCGGGCMKFGETFEQAARRELKEEYRCDALNLQLCGFNNVLRIHDGRPTHWIIIVFSALVDPKKVKVGDKHKIDEVKWFPKNQLPSPLHSMYLTHMEYVKKAKVI